MWNVTHWKTWTGSRWIRQNLLNPALLVMAALLSGTAVAEDVVRLGNLKFAHYGAVSYMKELAPKYGLKIEERMFAKGVDILPAIVAGEVDMAASALDAAIAGRAQGVPIYAVAGFAKGGARLVARSDLPIKQVADLKGRKVGVARGGAQELLLFAQLAKHNLTWSEKPGKDVQIVYMAFADLNQALLGKDIDAMCQSEPQSSQAIAKGFGVEVNKPYDTPMGEPYRSLVITEKLYREQPQVAQRVLDLFVEATALFIAQPDLAEKYVRETMFKGQITSAEFREAIGNSPYTYDLSLDHVQITTDFMLKYGVGKMGNAAPAAKDWVKLDLLERAKGKVKGAKS